MTSLSTLAEPILRLIYLPRSLMRTETLKVGGMTCGGCVGVVTSALRAIDGVAGVVVSLKPGEARIEFDERATSSERLREAVKQAGYEINVAGSESLAKRGCCS